MRVDLLLEIVFVERLTLAGLTQTDCRLRKLCMVFINDQDFFLRFRLVEATCWRAFQKHLGSHEIGL